MNSNPIIFVDIDNTILFQNRRKQKILFDIFEKQISISEIEKCFSLDKILARIAKENNNSLDEVNSRFNQVFFSQDYYEPEYLDVICNANKYLERIANELSVDIYYLSSRSSTERDITLKHLEYFGFPKPNERHKLFLMSPVERDINTFESTSYEVKDIIIRENVKDQRVVVGIGDTAADMAAYYKNNIQCILLQTFQTEESIKEPLIRYTGISVEEYDVNAVIGLDNWEEIYHYLEFAMGNDNSYIKQTCEKQSNDYANWLSDLDNKASMTLIISTFCATTLFDFVANSTRSQLVPLIIGCVGLFFSLLAVFLAIRSFASRETHGRNNVAKYKKSQRDLFSKDVKIKDCELALNSKYPNNAFAKYLKHRYGELDQSKIMINSFFGLRSSNYKKIYYENKAKSFLRVAILIMLVLSVIIVLNKVMVFINQPGITSENKVQIIQNETVFSAVDFSPEDFSESLSELNETGSAKVQKITKTLNNQSKTVYISISGLNDDKSISSYKSMIMGNLVQNAINKTHTPYINVVIIIE